MLTLYPRSLSAGVARQVVGEKESELPDLLTQVRLVTLEWRALTFEAGGSARSCVLSAVDVFKNQETSPDVKDLKNGSSVDV